MASWAHASPRLPLVIAPVMEGIGACEDASEHIKPSEVPDSSSICARKGFDTAAALRESLNTLEPGGPHGDVQVGYTLTIALLGLYEKRNDKWVLNSKRIDTLLGLISRVKRPVVIYLAANHFDTQGPLSAELVKDPRNLLKLADQSAPITDYFGNKVYPYTLLTDATIPVNRFRFDALRAVAHRIARLPAAARNEIVAVTMAGEVHQMFPDFESGMGKFSGIRVTDYSPESVAGFHAWLQRRYGSLAAFNRQGDFSYGDFASIPAPSKDIRHDLLTSFGEHYDGFADGTLPVSGWLWDPEHRITALDLYVDGKRIGPIQRGYNRLDVYRAVDSITDPNVGFRTNLDYTGLPAGAHIVQIVAGATGKKNDKVLMAEFPFQIVPRDQHAIKGAPPAGLRGLAKPGRASDVRFSLDLPKSGQDVYFNPLARDWDLYRNEQVRNFLLNFYEIAAKAGIPAGKLYSHQIVPNVNSTWNGQLFAADTAIGKGNPWHAGLNLYGGAADSDWVRGIISQRDLKDYGAPEFNPQQWKVPGTHLRAMRSQFTSGARFISPYYMSITSPRHIESMGALKRLELRPDNHVEGSADFYLAIQTYAKQ
jgi:hypothetical protein